MALSLVEWEVVTNGTDWNSTSTNNTLNISAEEEKVDEMMEEEEDLLDKKHRQMQRKKKKEKKKMKRLLFEITEGIRETEAAEEDNHSNGSSRKSAQKQPQPLTTTVLDNPSMDKQKEEEKKKKKRKKEKDVLTTRDQKADSSLQSKAEGKSSGAGSTSKNRDNNNNTNRGDSDDNINGSNTVKEKKPQWIAFSSSSTTSATTTTTSKRATTESITTTTATATITTSILPVQASNPLARRIEFQLASYSNPSVLSDAQNTKSASIDLSLSSKTSGKLELFPKRGINEWITWKKVIPIGPGLNNLGNTCFLNSVLQCLTYTPPLAQYLMTQNHGHECKTQGFCLLCEMENHISRCFNKTKGVISPNNIAGRLRLIAKHMRLGRQEDAHEFMRYIIEALQQNVLQNFPKNLDAKIKETSVIHRIFGGYLQSQIRCKKCNYASDKLDPFLDLSLEVKNCSTLTKALYHFTKVERLTGDNKYRCSGCKSLVDADKQFTVFEAPNILTIQLKRFSYFQFHGDKIDTFVEFPLSLDLKPWMSKRKNIKDGEYKYDLYAVLVHSGFSIHSGHYYCFVKNSTGLWYSMNDSSVQQVSVNKVLKQKAYILFYIKSVSSGSPAIASSKSPLSVPRPISNDLLKDKSLAANGDIQKEKVALNGVKDYFSKILPAKRKDGSTTDIKGTLEKKNMPKILDAKGNSAQYTSTITPPTTGKVAASVSSKVVNGADKMSTSSIKAQKSVASKGNPQFDDIIVDTWEDSDNKATDLKRKAALMEMDTGFRPHEMDERDMEFDKPRVKKVKNKEDKMIGFSKPNPFQQLAQTNKSGDGDPKFNGHKKFHFKQNGHKHPNGKRKIFKHHTKFKPQY